MELTPSKKVYTLFLNSIAGFSGLISSTSGNPNNVTWNVDWDALFNRENYIYKNCSVRVSLSGSKTTQIVMDNIAGQLVANFGQNFTGKNVQGVVLGQFVPTTVYYDVGAGVYVSYIYQILNTLTDALGQQIDMPYGLSAFNLQMWRPGFGSAGSAGNALIANPQSYNIMLQFELS
jgi:hypothetical protein